MQRSRALWMVVGVLSVFAACTSNRLVHSWTDPSVKKLEFNRVVAVALHSDGPLRRLAESEMVRIIGPKAVAASQVISDDERGDVDKVRAKLAAEGFDGAITMRLVDATTTVRTARDPVPMSYYQMWSYYGFYWIQGKGPDYVTADQTLQIEVNIYSLKDGKLLWTGISETAQPKLVETLVKEVGELVSRRLRSEGLVE